MLASRQSEVCERNTRVDVRAGCAHCGSERVPVVPRGIRTSMEWSGLTRIGSSPLRIHIGFVSSHEDYTCYGSHAKPKRRTGTNRCCFPVLSHHAWNTPICQKVRQLLGAGPTPQDFYPPPLALQLPFIKMKGVSERSAWGRHEGSGSFPLVSEGSHGKGPRAIRAGSPMGKHAGRILMRPAIWPATISTGRRLF